MSETLITIGVACVIAAIVGGGLEAAGIKFPVLNSVARQLLAAAFGLLLCLFGFYYDRLRNPAPAATGNAAVIDKTGVEHAPPSPDPSDGNRVDHRREDEGKKANDPPEPPEPSPPEDISGLWNDANGTVWKLDQDGSKFAFAPASGEASTHGNGEIEGKTIMLRAWIGGVLHTCILTLSGTGTFITGPCQSTGPGNSQFQVRWSR
jgi:hypothetical protein